MYLRVTEAHAQHEQADECQNLFHVFFVVKCLLVKYVIAANNL